MLGVRHQELEKLRTRIAALESRPALAGHPVSQPGKPGLLKIPAGVLSEIFADEPRDSGSALGFSLGLAKGLMTADRPALIFLQLGSDAQKTGLPYGAGLSHFGIPAEQFVLARPQTIIELLWAMEEAIACRAVAAVVADLAGTHKALDFTASRRLSLRSASAGTGSFLVRYATGREASAAKFRWKVAAASSGPQPFDPRAPGPPRWHAVLERGRLQPGRAVSTEGEDYLVDWTEDGFVLADIENGSGGTPAGRPALPRPQPAALGHRLSQAG